MRTNRRSAFRCLRCLLLSVLPLAPLAPPLAVPLAANELLLVHESAHSKKPDILAWLDPETFQVLASVEVGKNTLEALVGPEGRTLYLAARGGRGSEDTLTVVDLGERRRVAEFEIDTAAGGSESPHGPRVILSADGSRLVLFERPNRLLVVDRRTHSAEGGFYLSRDAQSLALSPDGRLAFALHVERGAVRRRPFLDIVDLDRRKVLRTLPLGVGKGQLFQAPGGEHVYVLAGGPSLYHPKSTDRAQLWIFEARSGRAAEPLDLGFHPAAHFDEGSGLLLVANDRGPERSNELRWILDGEVTARTLIAGESEGVHPDPARDRAFVWSGSELRLYESAGPRQGMRFELSFVPAEIQVGRSGRRAFVRAAVGSKVAILDLEAGTVAKVIKTGRKQVRVAKALPGVALGAATGFFYATLPRTTMLASPEEERLYVLNSASNDVTVIDVGSGEVLAVTSVGPKAFALQLGSDDERLVATSYRKTTLIDTRNLEVLVSIPRELGSPELPALPIVEEAGRRLLVPTRRGLVVRSLTDGKHLGRVPKTQEPRLLLRLQGSGAAAPEG